MRDEDHERFTALWTQAYPAISGFIFAVVADPHAADDVVQEVAVILLRKFGEYDSTRPFLAWAMGVAKLAILAERRDRARARVRFHPGLIETLSEAWHEALPTVDARGAALQDCLHQLGDRARELLALRYEQDIPSQDIAERLGMTAVGVRVALNRVRAALQDCIDRRLARP